MAVNESEHSSGVEKGADRRNATILAFRPRATTDSSTKNLPVSQEGAEEPPPQEVYAANIQAREFSLFDVFVLGAAVGGIAVYLALNFLWSDRFFVRPELDNQLTPHRVQQCENCDRGRPWLSPY
ncbi:hypothetical protein [Rhizobium sp. Rhizsp82]|uniref:hypothetical protein n=1 Tax=Rhizobium sp. Rhizsp82 TaxID=3243057 RepID=UPI0039B3EC43